MCANFVAIVVTAMTSFAVAMIHLNSFASKDPWFNLSSPTSYNKPL